MNSQPSNAFSPLIAGERYFLPYQRAWIDDKSPLKIVEKSRQIGFTYADSFDSVAKAAAKDNKLDVLVSSRDEDTAKEYLRQCKRWAEILNIAAKYIGQIVFYDERNLKAYALEFASGRRIITLSSHPDALVGKPGHIKLDEFAIHKAQRDLYKIAKPCTTWGGQLSIISTHRGIGTAFNEIITDIKENNNPMGWSHHRVTIQDAVNQGLVERISLVTGRNQTREEFLSKLRAECLDEEQWQQEYCCQPADDNAAFISYDMIAKSQTPGCMKDFEYLATSQNRLFVGVDVARKKHLCVIDVGELIGDIIWDRMRIELQDKPFSEIESELYRILELRNVRRCCIDATGLGMQLAERARQRFGWKVEPVTFNPGVKEHLAYRLRFDMEERHLRIACDEPLRLDLRGVRKEVTVANNCRLIGETKDGHCDRFWAKALRQHAIFHKINCGAVVI